MSETPAELKYTKEHEWVRMEGNVAVVGITDHAQGELGDIVYIELPKVGDRLASMKTFGVIESVKAASDLYSPLTGKVIEINKELDSSPEIVNKDPYGDGWMLKLELADKGEIDSLLNADDYKDTLSD